MKIDRLISIIMILLEKKRVSSHYLAEKFEVSNRTIYRDLQTINMAGIPILSIPGTNGGYEIMPDYKIDKSFFKENDLSVILMGLSNLSNITNNKDIMQTFSRLKSLLPNESTNTYNPISVDIIPWINTNIFILKNKDLAQEAIKNKKILSFSYLNLKGELTHREIEPYQLILKNNEWYIYGYCLVKNDYRIFKVSRVIDLKVLEKIFLKRDFVVPILDPSHNIELKKIDITIKFHHSLLERILDFANYNDIKNSANDYYTATISIYDNDYYYNMILGFGDKCECLSPKKVRNKIKEKISNLYEAYCSKDN